MRFFILVVVDIVTPTRYMRKLLLQEMLLGKYVSIGVFKSTNYTYTCPKPLNWKFKASN